MTDKELRWLCGLAFMVVSQVGYTISPQFWRSREAEVKKQFEDYADEMKVREAWNMRSDGKGD